MSSNNILLLNQRVLLFTIIVALNACCINAANPNKYGEYEHDRVLKMPGQPPNIPWVSQFSGYISVNNAHGRALFYWFFEAQSQPSNKPLILWLNGGPGCSSVGYGAALEVGPLRVVQNGSSLVFNQYAWNKEANLLFVESPAGVGFSYTNTPDDFNHMNDKFVAEDTCTFLVGWLNRFPQYMSHDFYIAGESYAGHYVPQLAELVHDRNKLKNKPLFINLKGFIVGNALTDNYYDAKGYLEYAWSHSVISDQTFNKARRTCDYRKVEADWSDECMSAMEILWDQYAAIDVYNIYGPSCLLNQTTSFVRENDSPSQNRKWRKRKRVGPGGYDPCYNAHTEKYFNRRDVQAAFHVKLGRHGSLVKWNICNYTMFEETYKQDVFSVLPIYTKLITKSNLRIWVYSGDADGRVPFIGSRYCVEALQLRLMTNWTPWFYGNQVAGRIVEYKGLTYVTVRGAGHMVPYEKPELALALIHSYLSGQPLPTHRY